MCKENYDYFYHDGFRLAFWSAGEELGNPVLLIHGFSASVAVNWINVGWFEHLLKAGHRVIAFDHRGHGLSDKSYNPADYAPELMASDGIALLDHLGLEKAHIMGYSMGGRLAVYTAVQAPERVQSAVFGGVGLPILTEERDWKVIHDALLAPCLDDVSDPVGHHFRQFAETYDNINDLKALAACAVNLGKTMPEQHLRRITMPALVAVGDNDELIPDPEGLAALLPRSEILLIRGCDHLQAVVNKAYRQGSLDFFAKYPFKTAAKGAISAKADTPKENVSGFYSEAGIKMYKENCEYFYHDGFRLAFRQAGKNLGNPVLLIHGFASSSLVNWVSPGWIEALLRAGHRVIAIDNRGHGFSEKSSNPADYTPELMADDAAALLEYLGLPRAHIAGYSMGARISAYLALRAPEKVQSLIFGGLGIGMVTGAGEWQSVYDALLAPDMNKITDKRGLMFRKFAEHTKSDLSSLAACVMTSKKELTEDEVRQIAAPALVAVGSKDEIAGAPQPLAALLPQGRALIIPDRNHLLAVGDKIFKREAVTFLAEYPL